jgi:hypothetical protein
MRKFFVFAVLGLAGLGMLAGQASAGSLLHCLCCKKCCCMKLCATQYNAFSPFCLDSLSGCVPCQGGIGAACMMGNGGYGMGELPDGGQLSGMPMGNYAGIASGNPYAGVQVPMPQGGQIYGQGMVSPMVPAYPPVTGYAPANGNGR